MALLLAGVAIAGAGPGGRKIEPTSMGCDAPGWGRFSPGRVPVNSEERLLSPALTGLHCGRARLVFTKTQPLFAHQSSSGQRLEVYSCEDWGGFPDSPIRYI